MDASVELRRKLVLIADLKSHTLRRAEIAILDRLLYKNRSQHRHGSYFRKLEHVRRLEKKCERHPAWEAVHKILGAQQKNPSDALPVITFTPLTVQDFEQLHGQLTLLAEKVLPAAAVSIVDHLIMRQHFLHFSVSIIAVLARLRAFEHKLCVEVSAALTQMRMMLARNQMASATRDHEDLGEPVGLTSEKRQQRTNTRIRDISSLGSATGSTTNLGVRAGSLLPKPCLTANRAIPTAGLAEEDREVSFFDLMYSYNPQDTVGLLPSLSDRTERLPSRTFRRCLPGSATQRGNILNQGNQSSMMIMALSYPESVNCATGLSELTANTPLSSRFEEQCKPLSLLDRATLVSDASPDAREKYMSVAEAGRSSPEVDSTFCSLTGERNEVQDVRSVDDIDDLFAAIES